MKLRPLFLVCLVLVAVSTHAQTPLQRVDPLVGTKNGGNTTPGTQVPFGFISLGPDTAAADHGFTNGYNPDAEIIGFSYTHESGTGGESKYGNFRATPTTGTLSPRNLLYPWRDESATPGYYAVTIGTPAQAIRTEHTATRLVGYSRYRFPAGQQANVLLDVSSRIRMQGGRSGVPSVPQAVTDAGFTLTSARAAEGYVAVTGGWNPAPYTLYFAAEFNRDATETGAWDQNRLYPGKTKASGVDQTPKTMESYRNQLGAYFTFAPSSEPITVEMRLAVSFISVAQARETLAAQHALTFEQVHEQATQEWSKVLAKIDVEGGTADERNIFYTAMYRAHTMPHDLTGENTWWQSPVPHYEDFYTLWDTFRTLHPLYTLIEPERQTAMVQSLLDTYSHTGWLPDARIAGANGLVQGGTNGDVLIADAMVKHLPGIDWKLAYAALKQDADVSLPTGDQGWFEGRQLDDWKRVGYMSLRYQRSASRTLEYAADDYSVATAAHLLGEHDAAHRYLKSSANWQNLWDAKLQCIHPKYADGAWLENFTCDHLYPDYLLLWWDVPFYEGSSTQYSTYVPQDFARWIELLGGNEKATRWLDRLFDEKLYTQGNEPDILAPYTYIYTGRQDRTVDRVRHILATNYATGRGGLPGNDDAGTMSSWYVWSAMGIYPVAGQPIYLIGSPLFTRTTIHLPSARDFLIRTHGKTQPARYIQFATLNGRPLVRAWLTHNEIAAGGTLDLHFGAHPVHWDVTPPPTGTAVWNLIDQGSNAPPSATSPD